MFVHLTGLPECTISLPCSESVKLEASCGLASAVCVGAFKSPVRCISYVWFEVLMMHVCAQNIFPWRLKCGANLKDSNSEGMWRFVLRSCTAELKYPEAEKKKIYKSLQPF